MSSSTSRNLFLRLFPPPKFLLMPAVGLDISDEVVRFAELKHNGSFYELGKYGEKKIPADVIELGFIKDKEGLTQVLRELKKENGLEFVNASLPEEKAYAFRTKVPQMADSDIRSALSFKIEESAPVSLQSAVFDYKTIGEPDPQTHMMDVGVTVVHVKVVSSYIAAIQEAGLRPLEMRTEAQAIAQVVIPRDDKDTYIVVGVRETKTILAIVSNNIVQFTSTLPIGGKSITESIKKNFEVSDSEAEKIKTGKVVPENNEMFMSLVNAGSILRDEVQKLVTYWNEHSDVSAGKPIQHILLSGSDALLGLDTYLGRSFPLPVQIVDPWKNIVAVGNYVPPLTKREALDYVPALGLALPND